jgi:nitroreductase
MIITHHNGELPNVRGDVLHRCILCGHCEAACPPGAITVDDVRLESSTGYHGPREFEPERLGTYLRMRRTMRRYREEPVDRATIGRLMDVVRFAPTGGNRQPVTWLVVHDTRELRRLTSMAVDWMRSLAGTDSPFARRFNLPFLIEAWEDGRDYICRHAPHLVMACAVDTDPVAKTDAVIALTHLDIIAPSFGLGTCWGGIFQHAVNNWAPLQSALNLPREQTAIHCLMLGYPAIHYQRPPKRKPADIAWR